MNDSTDEGALDSSVDSSLKGRPEQRGTVPMTWELKLEAAVLRLIRNPLWFIRRVEEPRPKG